MNKLFIYSYNELSKGSKDLANTLGISRIKHFNSKFKADKNKTVINWGSSELPKEVMKCKILNHPKHVGASTNKLAFLDICHISKVRTPAYTQNKAVAKDWISKGSAVMCRRILNGSGGAGIVYATTIDELINAPLYTKYVPKDNEYRVHFYLGRPGDDIHPALVFYVQRKYRNPEVANPNWTIRNLKGGFLYEHNNIRAQQDVLDQSYKAFKASNLDFGAVDVLWNNNRRKAYVLEINTAPGLEGQTLQEYKNIFIEMNR